jgi:hypothetical protein
MEKGQGSVETLIILSISLLLLTTFVIFAWDQMVVSYGAQQNDIGKAALFRIVDEVNDAYYLGIGTKKTFEVVMPDSIDISQSVIFGRTLILNVSGSDVIANTEVDVNGVWSEITGKTTIQIEVQSRLVQIRVNPQ